MSHLLFKIALIKCSSEEVGVECDEGIVGISSTQLLFSRVCAEVSGETSGTFLSL